MTTRHTFLVEQAPRDTVIPTNVLVVRESDGRVVLIAFDGNRHEVAARVEAVINFGGVVLSHIEGERNLSTGTASVWA